MAAQQSTKVQFNLETAEREKSYEPYTVALTGGVVITMTDPAELDWKEILLIENPSDFFKFCVSDEDKDHLRKEKIPGWKMRLLIEDYQRHYGLDKPGNGSGSPI